MTPDRVGASLALLAALAGCHRARPSSGECDAMLERYVDMTLAGDPALRALPPSQEPLARELRMQERKAAESYRRVAEQCQREVSRAEYDCAMKSRGPNEWEACIE